MHIPYGSTLFRHKPWFRGVAGRSGGLDGEVFGAVSGLLPKVSMVGASRRDGETTAD